MIKASAAREYATLNRQERIGKTKLLVRMDIADLIYDAIDEGFSIITYDIFKNNIEKYKGYITEEVIDETITYFRELGYQVKHNKEFGYDVLRISWKE